MSNASVDEHLFILPCLLKKHYITPTIFLYLSTTKLHSHLAQTPSSIGQFGTIFYFLIGCMSESPIHYNVSIDTMFVFTHHQTKLCHRERVQYFLSPIASLFIRTDIIETLRGDLKYFPIVNWSYLHSLCDENLVNGFIGIYNRIDKPWSQILLIL